ncbi:MAG: ATP-binding protein [Spirochaetia bacterium]|nr:ATP-binding protein [Spirochaetia bacterium]
MFIEREIEEIVLKRSKTSKCLLLTGPRQVGKSTLLRKIFPDIKYMTFDDQILLEASEEDPKLFIKNASKPVMLDEVQYASKIFPYIKMECDNTDNYGSYILTGSQQMRLMEKSKESLAGRISILELQGLSLRELNGVKFNRHFVPTEEYISLREKKLKPYENLWKIIHRGMYPQLHTTDRDWMDFYSSYVKTYLERDIRSELNIKDEIAFRKFLAACAARTGQLLNYANMAEDVGVSMVTIKSWISVLERTGLIYILQPYYSSHLNRAIKTPKLYFRDTGLCCYLSKWYSGEALEESAISGNIFETFVVSEIIKSFTNEGMEYDFNLFYYRGNDKSRDSEIDLIIEQDGILYPVEIKKSASPNVSMANAFNVLDKEVEKKRGLGVILCRYDQKLYLKENLVVLPIEYL